MPTTATRLYIHAYVTMGLAIVSGLHFLSCTKQKTVFVWGGLDKKKKMSTFDT